ncbi:toxic anion resistance protein [Peribacillus psychrosaccharolyticus]|uniref:toxic anion resistance protein n=1 Tax=Peribacillus psychrosaccharolyticus TaxID=1407 RepID=UPI000315FDB6|nr:toxic anion resistance protein [Peribacillus psychrosaccharolyticus]
MKNEDEYYRQVELLAGQLDLTKPRIVLSYGVNIQAKMLPFTRQMLEQIQSKKVNQTGEVIKGLMRLISELGQDEGMKNQSFLRRVFKKNDSLTRQLVSYQKASAAVEQARVKLDRNKNFLLADTLLLNRLFTQNNELYHELNVYLTAGELKRQELIRPLPEQEHIEDEFVKRQEAEQRHHIVEVLDKRLYDLRVSIEITKQNSVLIKLIQGTNERLIEKIQSSILTSIPLWRNQVALTMANLQNQEIISAAEKII